MSDSSVPLTIITHRLERAAIETLGDQIEANFLATPASPHSANPLVVEEGKSPRPVKIDVDTQFIFYTAQPLKDKELAYLTEIFHPLRVYDRIIHAKCQNLRQLPDWKALILNLGDEGAHKFAERTWKTIQEDDGYCTIALNNSGWLTDMGPVLKVLEAQMFMPRLDPSRPGEDFLQDLERTVLPPVRTGLASGIRKLMVYEFLGIKIWTIALNVALWALYSSTGKCHDTVAQAPEAPTAPP